MPVLTFTKREGGFNGFHHASSHISYPNTDGVSDPLPVPPMPPGSRLTVYASPGSPSKDTVGVDYTLSSDEDVAGGSAVWEPWPLGDVSEASVDTILGPVSGLRFRSSTTATPDSTGNFLVVA